MSAIISNQDKLSRESLTNWDKAIEEAQVHIRRLVIAISDFRAKKAAGTPWPGTQLKRQTRKPCHRI